MKKFLSLMLAMLMLAMPTLSLAEGGFVDAAVKNGRRSETTVTVTEFNQQLLMMLGADAETLSIISDVLNALSFTGYVQESELGFAMNLQETPIVTGSLAVDGETVLAGSNLLGKPLAFTSREQAKATLERLLNTYAEALDMTQSDVQEVLALFDQEIDPTQIAQVDTDELANLDFSAFVPVLTGWAAKVKQEAVTEQPQGCDPATDVVSLVLTADEMNQLIPALVQFIDSNADTEFARDFIQGFEQNGLNWERDKEKVAEMAFFAGNTELVCYLNGGDIVKLNVLTGFDNEGEVLPITATYSRLNDAHTAIMTLADVMMIDVSYAETAAENETGMQLSLTLTIMQDGASLAFGITADNVERMTGEDAYGKTDISLNLMGMDIVTLTIETQTCAPKALMSAADAVDLPALSDADYQDWCTALEGNLSTALFTGLSKLPQSVLRLMYSE